jgi:hypothetical protein
MVDGFSIVLMEGLLLVPLAMAALFYPLDVLIGVSIVLAVALAVFETVEWVRHHPHHPRTGPTVTQRWTTRFPL